MGYCTSLFCSCSYRNRLFRYTALAMCLLALPLSLFSVEAIQSFRRSRANMSQRKIFDALVRHQLSISLERTASYLTSVFDFNGAVSGSVEWSSILETPGYVRSQRYSAAAARSYSTTQALSNALMTEDTSGLPQAPLEALSFALQKWTVSRDTAQSTSRVFPWDTPASSFRTYSQIVGLDQALTAAIVYETEANAQHGFDILRAVRVQSVLLDSHIQAVGLLLAARAPLQWTMDIGTDFVTGASSTWDAYFLFLTQIKNLPFTANAAFGQIQVLQRRRGIQLQDDSSGTASWTSTDRQLQQMYAAIEAATTTNLASCEGVSQVFSLSDSTEGRACLASFPVQVETVVQLADEIVDELERLVEILLSAHSTVLKEQQRRYITFFSLTGATLLLIPVLLYASCQAVRHDDEWHKMRASSLRKTIGIQAIKQSVGYVCHELRNPLHAMLASLELIGENSATLSTECRLAVAMLRRSAANLKVFSSDILDLQSVQEGKFQASIGEGNISDDLLAGLQMARAYLGSGVATKLSTQHGKNSIAVTDHHRLSQVLLAACTGLDQLYGASSILVSHRMTHGELQNALTSSPRNATDEGAASIVSDDGLSRRTRESAAVDPKNKICCHGNQSSSWDSSSGGPNDEKQATNVVEEYITLLHGTVEKRQHDWGVLDVVLSAVVEKQGITSTDVKQLMQQSEWTSMPDPRGLSLSLCAQTVEAMGGTVQVVTKQHQNRPHERIPPRRGFERSVAARSDPGRRQLPRAGPNAFAEPDDAALRNVPVAGLSRGISSWTITAGRTARKSIGTASQASEGSQLLEQGTTIGIKLRLPIAISNRIHDPREGLEAQQGAAGEAVPPRIVSEDQINLRSLDARGHVIGTTWQLHSRDVAIPPHSHTGQVGHGHGHHADDNGKGAREGGKGGAASQVLYGARRRALVAPDEGYGEDKGDGEGEDYMNSAITLSMEVQGQLGGGHAEGEQSKLKGPVHPAELA